MAKLISEGLWSTITAAVRKKPSRCHVAVAYFGNGACDLLPLSKGSKIVVDMSEQAVKAGQTRPAEVLKLVRKGVLVHSVSNLHAKVFAVDGRAFIGSSNASNRSAHQLLEAAVQVDARPVVAACRNYVDSLLGELVTPEFAHRMEKLYRPPRIGGSLRPRRAGLVATHSPLWLLPVQELDWDDEDELESEKGFRKAQAELRSKSTYFIEELRWSGKALLTRMAKNDLVLQVVVDYASPVMLPVARVLHVRSYAKRSRTFGILYLEREKGRRGKRIKRLIKVLGPQGRCVRHLNTPRVVRDRQLAHALLNLWQ